MVYGAGEAYIAQGFLLLLAGIPVYIWLKWRQSVAVTVTPLPPPASTHNGVATPERIPVGAGR
jgi:hypothetical protein